MPKVSPSQNNFNAGEFSPLMYGRVDFDTYKNALKTCLNHIPLVQGGITRRPGTYFAASVKSPTKATRLVPFEFSTTQAYIIEFGDQYVRFYRNNGRIETAGVPTEVATPYLEADLFQLKYTQSADVLYITHPSYAPRTLTRSSHTAWTLSLLTLLDGPYLSTNAEVTTLTPSAGSGAITITASGAGGINAGFGFRASDVGRWIRIKHASQWGYALVTGITSNVIVTANVFGVFGAATASATWRLGLYNSTDGYPAAVTFFEDRLFLAGAPNSPQRIDGSNTGAYTDFGPTVLSDGTVIASNAVSATMNSNDVQVIRWMTDDERGLLVGTTRAEWIVRAATTGEALSPTNISAKPSTKYGSANVSVLRAGKSALYVQRAGRKLRELAYVFEVDGFRSPDMTILSQHITKGPTAATSGIKEISYQQEPHSLVWAVRNDGALLGFTYERDQKVLGWHRHTIGGYSDAGHTAAALVESVACIPSADGTRDELWMVVKRYINGAVKRYVEYMTKVWEHGDTAALAVHGDCALTYSGAPTMTFSGADHLAGEVVNVLVDGAEHPQVTVTGGGGVTLNWAGSNVTIGYAYNSDGQQLRIEAGAADGTAQGKTQRTHNVTFRLHDTLGLQIGPDFNSLDSLPFRRSIDLTATAVPLFTGDKFGTYAGDYTTANELCWRFNGMLPGTVLSIMPQMHTQDR